jgi:uncharacterized membrane protein
MAREVIVATFTTRNQAYETANDIDRLSDGVIAVKSGALLEKDPLGNVTMLDSKDLPTAWGLGGAAGGALLGALIGVLAGPGGAAIGSAAGAAAAGTGAAAGGLVGGTTGASVDLINWGVKDEYIDLVRTNMLPGSSALIMEVEEGSTEPIDAAVRRHGGIAFRNPVTI